MQQKTQNEDRDIETSITDASDPLYEQVLNWVKADNAMRIACVQIRLRLGYSRARGLVERARRELHIGDA
jgi:DNA segregation ATPase FtsK/SpoIIIE-like protein